eukprot:scaffold5060_cov123-Skeletonema_dohrnii-CCMP3373.AAC.4
MAKKKRSLEPKATKDESRSYNVNDALINACTSLVYFLNNEADSLNTLDNQLQLSTETAESIRQVLEMVLVQAVRAASEVGDFVLINKLIYAAVGYATAIAHKTNNTAPLLTPRIFGEVITSMSKTKASHSKVKSLWNLFLNDVASDSSPKILSSAPSSYELNAMLTSLSERNKVSAALTLYRRMAEDEVGVKIEGDAYTASILFGMLADSISNGGVRNTNDRVANNFAAADDVIDEDASPCWQWNEALGLLDTFSSLQLNNFAYAALLKVNERATEVYCEAGMRHNGVQCAMSVLERMKTDSISPDVITCSTLMTTFDKGRNWKAAVTLLNAMEASSKADETDKKWSLPLPNTFTYALAISACARCNKGELALSILDQMETKASSDASSVEPNTWVYNAAIAACSESNQQSRSKAKAANLLTALTILEKMEKLTSNGSNGPDTVSYNTIFSLLDTTSFNALKELNDGDAMSQLTRHDRFADVVIDLLDSMREHGISRDAITYYNAIMACELDSQDALEIFRLCIYDKQFIETATLKDSQMQLKGRAASGVVFVANAALSVASITGDMSVVSEVITDLSSIGAKMNSESIRHIVRALGNIGDCEMILALLICLRGQDFANDLMKERYSIDVLSNLSEKSIPMIEEEIYSAAITSSLRHDQLGVADQVLLSMKKNGLTLNQNSLKEIILEYCRMAIDSSKDEFKIARLMKRQEPDVSVHGIVEPIYITSLARAQAAMAMLKGIEHASPSLLSPVAKACCAAGLWQEARSIVRRMHRAAIRELQQDTGSSSTIVKGEFLAELPRLHRSLLKYCAKGGNITPALNFADDIQFLASKIRQHGKSLRGLKTREEETDMVLLSSRLSMAIETPDNVPEADFSDSGALYSILERPIGLTGQDWKLILIAASRGGHWKVCVGTLPFIRPYVKETHPMYARELAPTESNRGRSRPSLARLNRKYDRIARALTAAILCFEARSQYAWAIRAIDDWIEWSGRRPRKEAVASACRVLAKRYRGQEVINLVARVMCIPEVGITDDDASDDDLDYTYEKALYTESINALYKHGMYEEADQLYAEGAASGHLPWAVMEDSDPSTLKLDLHGMSIAVAHSAICVSLQKETARSSDGSVWDKDVVIITGTGRRSGERFRPVLTTELQKMLQGQFVPSLAASAVPGNKGMLKIPREDIVAWFDHQRRQKRERLLAVAEAMRDITSGDRLERALMQSSNRLERALRQKYENVDEE